MMRRTASAVLIVVVSILAAAFVMEWAVRVLAPQALPPAYMVPDPDLGLRLAANARTTEQAQGHRGYDIRTNGAALRMDDAVDLSAARRRIMVYGDGSAFGAGLPIEATYVRALSGAARRADPVAQVLNAAVPGYTTGHVHLQLSRHADTLAPAIPVYFLGRHTLEANAQPDRPDRVTRFRVNANGEARLVRVPPYPAWERVLLAHTPYGAVVQHSHLRVLVRRLARGRLNWHNALADPASASAPLPDPPLRAEDLAEAVYVNELQIQRLADLCERASLGIVLVWVPDAAELDGAAPVTLAARLAADGRAMLARLAADGPKMTFIDSLALYADNPAEAPPPGAFDGPTDQFTVAGAGWFAGLVEDAVLAALARGRPAD